MTGLLVVLIPLLLLLFAFAMERIEASLLDSTSTSALSMMAPNGQESTETVTI